MNCSSTSPHAAEVKLSYLSYPAPQPLEALWTRSDLGAVFMCGYPVALKMAPVVPLAAPIPRAALGAGTRGVPLRSHRAQRLHRTARLRIPSGRAPAGP